MDSGSRRDPLTYRGQSIAWRAALALPPMARSQVVATAPNGTRYRPFRFVASDA